MTYVRKPLSQIRNRAPFMGLGAAGAPGAGDSGPITSPSQLPDEVVGTVTPSSYTCPDGSRVLNREDCTPTTSTMDWLKKAQAEVNALLTGAGTPSSTTSTASTGAGMGTTTKLLLVGGALAAAYYLFGRKKKRK